VGVSRAGGGGAVGQAPRLVYLTHVVMKLHGSIKCSDMLFSFLCLFFLFSFSFFLFCELVGKGGEGATAREVLKWKSVEKVVMVDIDEVRP
jgi:hypothetical protein